MVCEFGNKFDLTGFVQVTANVVFSAGTRLHVIQEYENPPTEDFLNSLCGLYGSQWSTINDSPNRDYDMVYLSSDMNNQIFDLQFIKDSTFVFPRATVFADISCPTGQHWNGTQCVSDIPTCPTGQHWDGNNCVPDARVKSGGGTYYLLPYPLLHKLWQLREKYVGKKLHKKLHPLI